MRLKRTTLALALFFGLTTVASAAQRGTKALPAQKKHSQLHQVHGVVVSVEHDKMKDHGEINVKVQRKQHKKTAKTAAATSKKKHHHGIMTFKVNRHTKFEKVIHSQGKVQRHPAHFGDLRPGEHVRVAFDSQHHALKVEIIVHHGKKLTPTPAPAKGPPLKKPE